MRRALEWLHRLITLYALKTKSLYWVGSCAIDRSGGTKHPGMVLAVGDLNAHLIPQVDAGGDPRVVPQAWDRMFPGWRNGVALIIFYPKFEKSLTQAQFVKSLEDMGQLQNMTTEQVKEAYKAIRPTRTCWVTSVAMKKIPYRRFTKYWRSQKSELGPL